MPGPVVGPCGGPNQPACPPVPASSTNETLLLPEEAIINAALQMSDAAKNKLTDSLANQWLNRK